MQKTSEKPRFERVEEGSSFFHENPSINYDRKLYDNPDLKKANNKELTIMKIDRNHDLQLENDSKLHDSFHQRMLKYKEAKARIFRNNLVPKRIKKCRDRYRKRREFARIIESTVINEMKDNRPYAKVAFGPIEVFGLLDSGASISVLGKDCLQFLEKLQLKYTPIYTSLKTADGNKQNVIGFLEIDTLYNKISKKILFYLSPSLSQHLYLGINFWKSFNIAPELFVLDISLDSEIFSNDVNSNVHNLTDLQLFELKRIIEDFSFL